MKTTILLFILLRTAQKAKIVNLLQIISKQLRAEDSRHSWELLNQAILLKLTRLAVRDKKLKTLKKPNAKFNLKKTF